MSHRIPSCFAFVVSLLCIAGPACAATNDGCVPGVYLVQEGSGTQSLWSFSSDGTLHTTSSAQGAFSFGDGYGAWKHARGQQVESTVLDFSYSPTPVGGGVPPSAIARVDAVWTFSRGCRDLHGSFELRFFDPASEDPLNRSTDTGAPVADTFTGRRVGPL